MDLDHIKTELSGLQALRALSPELKDALLNEVLHLLSEKFAELPSEQLVRLGSRVLTWLIWRERRRSSAERRNLAQYAVEHVAASGAESPSDALEFEQARAQLVAALHEAIALSLTPEEQLVVLRRFVQGVGTEAVAAELGVSDQRVYYLTRRALFTLRQKLSEFQGLYS